MTTEAQDSVNDLPSVAVIVPVFNDQAGISACLAALERQTYPSALIDVIVVDNCSDEPIRIPDTAAIGARVIPCDKPGAYAARNAGIAASAADVLAFTDADCVPVAHWVERGVRELQAASECRVVGGEVTMRLSARPTATELYQVISGFEQRENIEQRGFSVTANLFVRRDAMAEIGDFDTRLLSGGDREWSQRATAAGYSLVYAADAEVQTRPRRSLRAAARQARRVAGGRKALRNDRDRALRASGIESRRGVIASILWILRYPELGLWDRLRVLAVAKILYAVQLVENIRLALGGSPERR